MLAPDAVGSPSLVTLTECPSPDVFLREYFHPERPVLIKGVAAHWPARTKWSMDELRATLRGLPSVTDRKIYFLSDEKVLPDDFQMPDFVDAILSEDLVMADSVLWRFWINSKGNWTRFHCDNNARNVINIQVRGRKDWVLVSPDTPVTCYPFTNYGLLQNEEKVLVGKTYFKFEQEEGDLLYVPAYWGHRVIGKDDENINLNVVYTKRYTDVLTKELKRDLERCMLLDSARNHRFAAVRYVFEKIIRALPKIGGINWSLNDYIATPYQPGRLALLARFFREIAAAPAALATIPEVRATLRKIDRT